ncbi:MAG: peptidylprolyl isomerase, partial [Myxococcota bacterium]
GANERGGASHILLTVPEGTTPEASEQVRARASAIRAEITSGVSFEDLAGRASDDTGAPQGDLGCFARGEMLQAFEEAAFTQEIGVVSEPVRTQMGFHLIRVNSREVSDEGCSTEEELAPVQAEIYQEELERQMNAWVEELRQKSFVEVRL